MKRKKRLYFFVTVLLLFAIVFAIRCSTHKYLHESDDVRQKSSQVSDSKAKQSVEKENKATPSAVDSGSNGRKQRYESAGKTDRSRKVGNNLSHGNIERPSCEINDSLVINRKGGYTLQYSPHHRSAVWVAYKLTYSDTRGSAGRAGSFKQDAELKRRNYVVVSNSDYRNSPYDKGHLLPSGDRQRSRESNIETFLLSNCSPQLPQLNRGTWKSLEEQLRKLTRKYDTLYIVTGPLLSSSRGRLGQNRITVPRRYFKVVLARSKDKFTSFAYIIPNSREIDSDFNNYRVPLDSVERVSGIDFFPAIRVYD